MFGNLQTHQITRRIIVAFGNLFSDLKVQRFNHDGDLEQLIDVPISYGNREKWYQRLKEESELDKRVLITLPRIGFEIVGFNYDGSRKLNKFNQYRNCGPDENGKWLAAYSPVPYNIEFQVYIMTKTNDEVFQLTEQILPYFSPQYTMSVKVVDDLHIVKDIPITIRGVQFSDSFEGPMSNRREVIATLTFDAQVEYFGPVKDVSKNIIFNTDTKLDPTITDMGRQINVRVDGTYENHVIIDSRFDIFAPINA